MEPTVVVLIAGSILAWAVASAVLRRAQISAAMAFVAAGVLADAVGWVDLSPESVPVRAVAEVTLVLLLFSDAARVDLPSLRQDAGFPVRLLAVGLPLTVGLGALLAWGLFPKDGVWAAVLVGACLAPTDAGLGAAMVNDPAVPRRIRRTLNVESGLNDGIVAPLVAFAIAAVAETELDHKGLVSTAAEELVLGTVIGVVVGTLAGQALARASKRGWTQPAAIPIGTLATAVLAYAAALSVDGNGFVAAFVAGLAFSPALRRLRHPTKGHEIEPLELSELGGQLLAAGVWFLFGAAFVRPVLEDADWSVALYAVASLTVVRMVPVALALVGMHLERPTIAFVGWFGPRGLASIVFALIAVEDIGVARTETATLVGVTVLLSVIAHGLSAAPLARAYGRWSAGLGDDHAAKVDVPEFRTRRGSPAGTLVPRGR